MKLQAIVAALLLTLGAAKAEARTLSFPQSNPQFSVSISDDWEAEATSSDVISAKPKAKGALFSFALANGEATDAGTVDEARKQMDKQFTDVEPGKLVRFSNKQGVRFFEQYLSAKQDLGEQKVLAVSLLFAVFTIDGKKYFIFREGTPAATERYDADLAALVNSIAPLAK